MELTKIKENKTFGGWTQYFEHDSEVTKTKMKFSCYLPCAIEELESCIIWLSGLTCTEENFITKAGAQKVLSGSKTMIICPDTSPRGLELPNEHDSYDFGSGAGFYVNATSEGYENHYQMYDYIRGEIVDLLESHFGVTKLSIMGHSMGGHGALILGLKEGSVFKSISAFSPIVNPSRCPWGQKALEGYLGADRSKWIEYDATELINTGIKSENPILIDQGLADEFLEKELLTDNFVKACSNNNQALEVRFQEGYDHSYFFISTFIEDHIKFHQKYL